MYTDGALSTVFKLTDKERRVENKKKTDRRNEERERCSDGERWRGNELTTIEIVFENNTVEQLKRKTL